MNSRTEDGSLDQRDRRLQDEMEHAKQEESRDKKRVRAKHEEQVETSLGGSLDDLGSPARNTSEEARHGHPDRRSDDSH